MRRSSIIQFVSVWAILLATSIETGAVDFAGGTGEPNDPYLIATAEQLIGMGQDISLRDKHFALVADIDLNPDLPGGRVFEGALFSLSSGSLDGNGHTILNFNAHGGRDIQESALCNHVDPGAVIRNLTLVGAFVNSGYALLVYLNEGTIANCIAGGVLRLPGSDSGGLVSQNVGTIMNSHVLDVVTNGSGLAGGLVGNSPEEGTIVSSYFLTEADGGGPDNGLSTALSDVQMKQQASFTGWDFENVWTICEGSDYPQLWWENISCQP